MDGRAGPNNHHDAPPGTATPMRRKQLVSAACTIGDADVDRSFGHKHRDTDRMRAVR